MDFDQTVEFIERLAQLGTVEVRVFGPSEDSPPLVSLKGIVTRGIAHGIPLPEGVSEDEVDEAVVLVIDGDWSKNCQMWPNRFTDGQPARDGSAIDVLTRDGTIASNGRDCSESKALVKMVSADR